MSDKILIDLMVEDNKNAFSSAISFDKKHLSSQDVWQTTIERLTEEIFRMINLRDKTSWKVNHCEVKIPK